MLTKIEYNRKCVRSNGNAQQDSFIGNVSYCSWKHWVDQSLRKVLVNLRYHDIILPLKLIKAYMQTIVIRVKLSQFASRLYK